MKVEEQTCTRGIPFPLLKNKSPYLWVTNKTAVLTNTYGIFTNQFNQT